MTNEDNMSSLNAAKSNWWIELLSLAIISALIYLLYVDKFSYLRDDWYYAYDGYIAGPSIFKVMFSSDRPARGLFYGIYYLLFGPQPLPYHIGAYLWRLLGALSALWLFHLLWPPQRIANFSMALLFLIYPGFLSWPSGIDYQPHLASVCLYTFSIALTLAAIQSTHKITRIFLWAGSIFTGLTAIALVDYAIGMEAFRIFCIFLLIVSTQQNLSFSRKVIQAIRASLIPLTIPLTFMVWKLFIFVGDRKATDISFQLSALIHAPVETILLWGERLYTSALNVSFLAWWTPLKQHYSYLQQNGILPGFLIAIIVIALFLITIHFIADPNLDTQTQAASKPDNNFPLTAIGLGLAGVVFGLFPVIMANRFVIFKAYSHYALPASLAAVILIVGLIQSLPSRKIQLILMSVLIGVSALTHRALAVKVTSEQETIRNFWWQVYWRIPKIEEGTTLAVNYPNLYYGEDTDIVWGPANFLYYLQLQPGVERVKYKLAGTKLDKTGIQNVLEETAKISVPYRSHFMFLNYHKVLVMSQPSSDSCVHVIDERWPEFSQHDTPETVSMFPHSKIKTALTSNEESSPPLGFVFGIEPAHTWCFYYQKAELARQQGDWETVAALGAETANLGLAPADPIEWTPFIQAYAYLRQTEKVEQLAAHFKDDSFHKKQICENLNRMDQSGYPLQSDMQGKVNDLFCQL
jgi:hypothetical protein